MKEMLQKLREASVAAILQADDITALENLRVKYLGKKGELTAVLKQMGQPVGGGAARPWASWPTRCALRSGGRAGGQGPRDAGGAQALRGALEAEALDVTVPGQAP